MHAVQRLLVASLALVAAPSLSFADEIRFALTVDHEVLRAALRAHLEERAGAGLELWQSGDGCGSFVLKDAVVQAVDRRLKVSGPAAGGAGVRLLGLCWADVSWTGHVEITTRPDIGPDWQL